MRAVSTVLPDTVTESLPIRPWPDPVIDNLGFDPRSWYVETFWLGVLGPSTTWLLRRLATGLESRPAGFELALADTARQLGLGDKGGRHSPFVRSLARIVQFELARFDDRGLFAVRRKVPPLNRRQLNRLPDTLRVSHQQFLDEQLRIPPIEHMRRRSRRLALSLLELGEDMESTERQLMRWRFHPALARESAAWAWAQHRAAGIDDGGGGDRGDGGDGGDRGDGGARRGAHDEVTDAPTALDAVREIAAELSRRSTVMSGGDAA